MTLYTATLNWCVWLCQTQHMLGYKPKTTTISGKNQRMVGELTLDNHFQQMQQNPIAHQPGGTGLVIVNQLSHQVMQSRSDELGLGWWSWVRLRGQAGYILRIILAYRPCFLSGPLLTYQQQMRYLAKINCTNSPKNRFLMDLEKSHFRVASRRRYGHSDCRYEWRCTVAKNSKNNEAKWTGRRTNYAT